jgi:hypothetical protein
MPDQQPHDKPSPLQPTTPAAPPTRRADTPPAAPDLHIEEIEERHVPKDRNIFDK